MLIPYGVQSYKRADLPKIRLENLYVEKTPAEPSQIVLLPRPGLAPYLTAGSGPARGIFQQSGAVGDALFTVSGINLYNAGTALGSIGGIGRVSMAASLNMLLIGTGSGFYRSDGATVTSVDFPDGAGVTSVGFIGGYSIAARTGTRRIYFSLDPTTWDGLDYLSAEQSTGNLVGFAIVSDQVWVFCEQTTEVFVLTGNATTPLQSVQGRTFQKGALTRDSIVPMDNTVFWVGHDGIVYRGDSAPQRVSDHGIEERIAESNAADISAWAFPSFGHTFYVLNTASGTFAYDAATQQWTEFTSYGRARWRASMGVLYGRDVIAGDDETGQLWKLDAEMLSDNGADIERYFTVIINKTGFVDNISLDCSVGQTDDPNAAPGILEMRTSRDDGQTFLSWRQTQLGAQGKSRTQPCFRRVGSVDQGNLLVQFRITDQRPGRISYVKVNEAMGGRSR